MAFLTRQALVDAMLAERNRAFAALAEADPPVEADFVKTTINKLIAAARGHGQYDLATEAQLAFLSILSLAYAFEAAASLRNEKETLQ